MKRYEKTMTRAEIRWHQPQEQEVVDYTLKVLREANADGWVCSGVNGHAIPLFPSQIYPYSHPQANREWLRYLLENAEAAGITVVSWYPLGHSKCVADKYPEYKVRFLDIPGDTFPSAPYSPDEMLCLNSPYLDLVVEFSKELIRLGFKGMWFDACHATFNQWTGCKCDYCRASFKKDTGFDIPETVDFSNPVFKTWVNWRYRITERAWTRLTEAVYSVNPDATVCFNNRRASLPSWHSGIPLRPLNINALIGGESNSFRPPPDFQIKLNRAMGGTRGVETWVPLTHDGDLWRGNPELETILQKTLGAVNAGGNVFCGTDNLVSAGRCLKEISTYLKPVWNFQGGHLLKYAGIWVSQQTMDFEMEINKEQNLNALSHYGANAMLNHAHLQNDVLFDDSIEKTDIKEFPVIIGVENTCVSDRQIEKLLDYVKSGGLLAVCGCFAGRNEIGDKRAENPFHDILGISIEERNEVLAYGKLHNKYSLGEYPQSFYCGYRFQKITHLRVAEGVTVAAMTVVAKNWHAMADSPPESAKGLHHIIDGPGVIAAKYGKGTIVYFNSDIFTCYSHGPNRFQMELVKKILTTHCQPHISLTAPMAITMNVFDRGEDYVVHLHNNPGRIYYTDAHTIRCAFGEIPPALDIECDVSKLNVSGAFSPVANKNIPLISGKFSIDRLDYYDVIVLHKN